MEDLDIPAREVHELIRELGRQDRYGLLSIVVRSP